MSMSFEDQMRNRRQPTAEEVAAEIQLPTSLSDGERERRRLQRQEETDRLAAEAAAQARAESEAAEERAAAKEEAEHGFEHGGSGGGGEGGDEALAETVSSGSAPEPAPQQDDLDDGEHTDSHAASDDDDVDHEDGPPEDDEQAEAEPEPVAEELFPKGERALTDEEEVAAATERMRAANPPRTLAKPIGGERSFEKTGFSVGDADMIVVKKLPAALVNALRESLAPAIGRDFADQMSAAALVTAFLMARTGIELDADQNTVAASESFRAVDPRLLSVESGMAEMREDFNELTGRLKVVLSRVSEIAETTVSLDFLMAWIVADRVDQFSTRDTTSDNIDLGDPRAARVRGRAHAIGQATRKQEQLAAGRRL